MLLAIDYNRSYIPPVSSEILVTSQYSTNSLIAKELFHRIIEDEQTKAINKKLSVLKANIGEDLFNKLTNRQRNFIIGVSGVIGVGKDIDPESFNKDSDNE